MFVAQNKRKLNVIVNRRTFFNSVILRGDFEIDDLPKYGIPDFFTMEILPQIWSGMQA